MADAIANQVALMTLVLCCTIAKRRSDAYFGLLLDGK